MSDSTLPTMLPLELNLVVAATRTMGIGRNGTLPWTGLKREMAYFARVTKRLPPSAAADSPSSPSTLNAVIMGRKTWDSIPAKFRPLKGRLNVVISRSHPEEPAPPRDVQEPVRVRSLEHAVAYLRAHAAQTGGGNRVFVIGGAQIYGAALRLPETRRVLLTRVLSDFECDTFFPLELPDPRRVWVRRSGAELGAWTGEDVSEFEETQCENGVRYEFQMWEKVG
ncbi:dihydrofolate reductase-like domain-containing protein [Xylariaceae sp. FL0662B]|nr:dihydrofolate reductase-like domain-containing protein [Xylariaceae sp. FL0662B]